MNFQNIKSKFIMHLKETSYLSQSDLSSLDTSNGSIFLHQDEFKKFLKSEYNITDNSLITMSISDILKMNIVDGKLIDKTKTEDEEDEEKAEVETEDLDTQEDEDSDIPTEEDTENGWISGFINDLFQNEIFKNYVDGDKNGEIDETEFDGFLNYVKDLDGNKDSLSLEDIFTSLEAMEKGTFDMTSADSLEQTLQTPAETDSSQTSSGDGGNYSYSSEPASSGSSSYSGGSDSSSGSYTAPTTDDNAPKSYDKMTEQELNQELNTAKNDLETNKNTLSAIANGTYSNSELDELKAKMDESYEAYKTALKPEDQTELDKITSDIAKVENDIAQKELEISEQNNVISSAQANLDQAKASYDSYDAQYKELDNKDTSKLSKEEKDNLKTKKDEAKTKRDEAKDKFEKAEEALQAEKDKLNTLNQELETLKTGENGLDALNNKKTEFEEKIKTDETISEKMTAYNDAKSKYDAKKAELKNKAETDYKASQDKINQINSAMENLTVKNDINTNLKFNSNSELFDPDAKLNMQYIKGENGSFDYMLIGPENADPNEELPVLVFLHGDGQSGRGEKNLWQQFCPPGFMKNWSMNNFRGYILCPVLPNRGDNWTTSQAESALRSMLSQFGQTHAINKNKIALTGASRGGMGTVYMAKHMGDVFCRAAALSAYNSGVNPSDVTIPLRGYYGSKDAGGSISYMNKNFSTASLTVLKGAAHCDVPKEAFTQDLDGDNCSDLIQWLFADDTPKLTRT